VSERRPGSVGDATAPPIACDVLVIGAGPAGLAAGAALRRVGIEPTLVERGQAVGWAWHGNYDRLRLHTVKKHSALPYLPFPVEAPRYPSRLEVIAYLETYARAFNLAPRFGEDVQRVYRAAGGWRCETTQARYVAKERHDERAPLRGSPIGRRHQAMPLDSNAHGTSPRSTRPRRRQEHRLRINS
jgi:glycine/D-amino acid oxidase-like deaminating enzyme